MIPIASSLYSSFSTASFKAYGTGFAFLNIGCVRISDFRTQAQDQFQSTEVYLDKHTAKQGRAERGSQNRVTEIKGTGYKMPKRSPQ